MSRSPDAHMAEARGGADEEGPTLLKAENTVTGYFGVRHQPGRPKPYMAIVTSGGMKRFLGSFGTPEEAAQCVARTPEGQAAAKKAAQTGGIVRTHKRIGKSDWAKLERDREENEEKARAGRAEEDAYLGELRVTDEELQPQGYKWGTCSSDFRGVYKTDPRTSGSYDMPVQGQDYNKRAKRWSEGLDFMATIAADGNNGSKMVFLGYYYTERGAAVAVLESEQGARRAQAAAHFDLSAAGAPKATNTLPSSLARRPSPACIHSRRPASVQARRPRPRPRASHSNGARRSRGSPACM